MTKETTVRRVRFDELKYGDKLATISTKGEIAFYAYLCPDPGWKSEYAFLMMGDGENARHFNRKQIESGFWAYDTVKDVEELSRQTRIAYYRKWLSENE